MKIEFDKYYEILGEGLVKNFNRGCLPGLIELGVEKINCFESCKKILDVGCGNGFWSDYLKSLGHEVTSCDIDNSLYKEAVVSDMHSLSFKDKKFDGVFCNGVFEHSISPFIMMCEINRVLKNNGVLFMTMPVEENELMSKLPQHVNILCEKGIFNLCEKSKFRIKHMIKTNDTVNGLHYVFIVMKNGDIK